jgi:hypothetical protein
MESFDSLMSSPQKSDLKSERDAEFIDAKTIEAKCTLHHTKIDNAHAKIYRYYSFLELIDYLKLTLTINLPFVDYPNDEILKMLLTATQLNHVEEKFSDELINLSSPSISYMNMLLNLLEHQPSQVFSVEQAAVFEREQENLYQKITTMLSFLRPQPVKRGRRRKEHIPQQFLGVDDESALDYTIDELDDTENNLRKDKIQSIFEISTTSDKFHSSDAFFGIKYLCETEKNLWHYFIFALKTASKMTELERIDSYESYIETWSRWREFLGILVNFMELEINHTSEVSSTLFGLNLMNIVACTEKSEMMPCYYDNALSTFLDFAFTTTKSRANITQILPIDLTLAQKYVFSSNPHMIESEYGGSGICLDSIDIRSKLIRLSWKYILKMSLENDLKMKFSDKLAKELLKLTPIELMRFFSSPNLLDIESPTENVFFVTSFELMRLMSRSWSINYDNFLDDLSVYLSQLKTLFDSLKVEVVTESDMDPNDSIIIEGTKTYGMERCLIVAKYQLSVIIKSITLSEAEWKIVDDITFVLENEVVSFGQFLREQIS